MDLTNQLLSYKNNYFRYALSITGNREDAMDAVQDMYFIVYKDHNKLRNKDAFQSWSMGILANCARKIYRKNKKYYPTSINDYNLESKKIDSELNMDLQCALNSITIKAKECIVMKYLLGYSLEEISQILHLPLGTVKSRLYNGLKHMQKELEGYDGQCNEKFIR